MLTDVHEAAQCAEVAQAVDVLQIPAFLCRQTDLLLAAAATGKVVNVKKGQFLAPWDMANVVAKITGAGNRECAGHRARRLVRLQHAGVRHAGAADPGAHHRRAGDLRRHPFGAAAGRQGRVVRRRARIRAVLARAAVAVGVAGVFIETHPDPDHAPSDGPNMVPLREFEGAGADADGVRRARQKHGALMRANSAAAAVNSRMPPVLNIIALATFAASLSARALDPVLPHVASDFGVSIATAAGFASVFAFTFAIIQPVLGAAADLFGKARLVIVCLVLLGFANILGALSSSFSLLFATRILAGIGAGGVFPIALGLTSDLVAPDKRQVAIGRTLAGSMTGNLLGASLSGLIGDFLGWRGVLAVLGLLAVVASVAVAIGFRGGALARAPAKVDLVGAPARLPHHLRQSEREGLLFARCSSKAAACSACFPMSPRSCSNRASPAFRSAGS